MKRIQLVFAFLCIFFLNAPTSLLAQEDEPEAGPKLSFGLGLDIGFVNLPNADYSESIGWQSLKLAPDFGVGEFGIGFDVTLNFRFDGGADGNTFEFRSEDWVPSAQRSFWDIYLPLFKYIRYGKKGSPFYALAGGIDNANLGNGFIVGGYRNTTFMPDRRIVGLLLDLDGKAFDFPYIGFESFIGNLAQFDFLGFRAYIRPLAGFDIDILKDLQVGYTLAYDANPHSYNKTASVQANPNKDTVLIQGVDMRFPILNQDPITLALYGDIAWEKDKIGSQIGFGGRLLSIFDYNFAARFMGKDFLPSYFDRNYDNFKEAKYTVYNGSSTLPAYSGYFGRIGLNIAQDILTFGINIDGNFAPQAGAANEYPNLQADFVLKPGSIIPDLSLSAYYYKGKIATLADLVSATNAVVGAKIGYAFGPATVSMIYNLRYDANSTKLDANGNIEYWVITSKLETSISILPSVGGLQ